MKRKTDEIYNENNKRTKEIIEWKDALQAVVRNCIHSNDSQKILWVVLSPDVDGVLSFCFLREWGKQNNVNVILVGEYDSEKLTLYNKINLDKVCEKALFLDLDQHFAQHNIGQHFLGSIDKDKNTYFNPNLNFKIKNYTSKYPYGTAQLIYWGLNLNLSAVESDGIGQSLFVHADSTYKNCHKYNVNAKWWASALFKEKIPSTLTMLLDNTYYKTKYSQHTLMLKAISKYVRYSTMPTSWETCGGFQSCKKSWKDNGHCTSSMFQMIDFVSNLFNLGTSMPTLQNKRIAWKGRRESIVVDDVDSFLRQQKRLQSHAVVYKKKVSVTYGEVKEGEGIKNKNEICLF